MKLDFLNREPELKRLKRSIDLGEEFFAVLYGRRRCGKSTLLQKITDDSTVYYLADQQEAKLQIGSIAKEISHLISGFNSVNYPSWSSLLKNLSDRSAGKITLIIDEFPYLVQVAPELPSVIQKYLDSPNDRKINLIICGSSQRMMYGLVLDSKAPLYGRAREIIKLNPLMPGWITEALNINVNTAIEYYSVFGGIPRYWELAADYSNIGEAVKDLILDREGVLHDEPMRLLLDDMQSAIQPFSILSLLGIGCRRISEIAGRLEKPITSMTRPLAILQELGYVSKEIPFGENQRNSKKTLYHIKDQFVNFYFHFVQGNKSMLEMGLTEKVWNNIQPKLNLYYSETWETLARLSVPYINIENIEWGMASRWWGKGEDGKEIEIDILAESIDKKYILAGEVKWSDSVKINEIVNKLKYSVANIPKLKYKKIIYALWLKKNISSDIAIITPQLVFGKLK